MSRLKVFHWKEIQDWQEFSNCLYFSDFDSFYFNPLRERVYPLEGKLLYSGNVLSVKLSKKGFAHAKLLRFLGNTMNFYLSKVNRSFIEIYSTLWSLWWMHNRMETMRIPTTMKIIRRKKKKKEKSCEITMKLKHRINYNSMPQNRKPFCRLFHFSKWPPSRFASVLYPFFCSLN